MGSVDLLLEEPRLRPFLPLLYAAWADGDLTSGEIDALRSRLSRLIDGDCIPAVEEWLQPDQPPPAGELARLGHHIRLGLPGRISHCGPASLGLRLAGSVPDSVVEALKSADESVGPFGPPAGRPLITQPSPPGLIGPMPEREPSFDLSELSRLLAGPHPQVRQTVLELLSRPEFALQPGAASPDHRRQVRAWLDAVAGKGIGALGFPPELGGAGDPGGFLTAFAAIAHHDLSLLTKFGVQFGLFAGSVMRLGTATHHPVVEAAITGDLLGCFAMSETGHGSNVAELQTTATYLPDLDEFEIDTPHPRARKDYIGNAAVDGTMAVVFARLLIDDSDHGIHAFLVPIRSGDGSAAAGVTIGDDGAKAGLNGVDNGWITFDRVRIPRAGLLDRFATVDAHGTYSSPITSPARRFFTTLGTLVGGRVSVAAAAVSAAETALVIAVRYAHRRRQFSTGGGPETRLIDYRSHQVRLMPRLAATYAYHFAAATLREEWVELEAAPGDSGHDRRAFEGRAAGVKAFATWHALDTVSECRQACGGQGYMAANRLGLIASDVDVFTTFEGDNTVLAQLLAKALLTDYRSSFDDLTPGRLVRHLAERVGGFLTESVPVVGAVGGDVTDPEICRELMRRRTRSLLVKLAERVKRRLDEGVEATEAFLDLQPHALDTARAATEQEAFESLLAAAGRAEGEVAGRLRELAVLFALWRVQQELGAHIISGLLTPGTAKEVRAAVVALSETVAADSLALVDAFGIPDEVISAPIGV
jgi:acyl-CoA oxidase